MSWRSRCVYCPINFLHRFNLSTIKLLNYYESMSCWCIKIVYRKFKSSLMVLSSIRNSPLVGPNYSPVKATPGVSPGIFVSWQTGFKLIIRKPEIAHPDGQQLWMTQNRMKMKLAHCRGVFFCGCNQNIPAQIYPCLGHEYNGRPWNNFMISLHMLENDFTKKIWHIHM